MSTEAQSLIASSEHQASKSARVVVVDDHPVVRAGLRFSLKESDGYVICGEAESLEEARSLIRSHTPHLVILDLNMGGSESGDVVVKIRKAAPHSAILVFSMSPEELFAARAFESGANGYLMKSDGFGELHRAMRIVLAGETYLSERMKRRGVTMISPADLTEREMQVFRLLGEGRTSAEIARLLGVSIKTVFVHRDNIKAKLGVENAAALCRQAMAWAMGVSGVR